MTETTLAEVMAELAELEDPKTRAVNEKHGDDHGVNLSKLRAVAKRLKTQQDLARELWATGDTAARLLGGRYQDSTGKARRRKAIARSELLGLGDIPVDTLRATAPYWRRYRVERSRLRCFGDGHDDH